MVLIVMLHAFAAVVGCLSLVAAVLTSDHGKQAIFAIVGLVVLVVDATSFINFLAALKR